MPNQTHVSLLQETVVPELPLTLADSAFLARDAYRGLRSAALAAAITASASKQTYLTIRLLVDRGRVANAYRTYAYLRWVDDWLDRLDERVQGEQGKAERLAFVERQCMLLDRAYEGQHPHARCAEEDLLFQLIASDRSVNGGLHSYLYHMMAVMAFDAERRGQLITGAQLHSYTQDLAIGVTEALHYFIGHDQPAPRTPLRYMAVTGAHVAHMLRDTLDDVTAGYYNIPREFLDAHRIDPCDVHSAAYREWVQIRVDYAQTCFRLGRTQLAMVKSLRCRLAGYAYMVRFQSVLKTIEQEHYCLRAGYPERKSMGAALRTLAQTIQPFFGYSPTVS